MDRREAIIRAWFDMWLRGEDTGIMDMFAPDVRYIESWGPQYCGAGAVKHWFDEWNRRGRVLQWDIRQYFHKGDQTVVEWYFRNVMHDGRVESFDGVSLIRWTPEDRICFLQEFGCNEHRYDPYQSGPVPHFQGDQAKWF